MCQETEKEFLKKYDDSKYKKPSVTADIVIFSKEDKEIKVLLIKRKNPPFQNMLALPGGFAEEGESVDETAARELEEETGLKDCVLEQLRTFSTPGRDPRTWVITCAYLALIDAGKQKVTAGDDAAAAEWFSVSMQETDGGYQLELSGQGAENVCAKLQKTERPNGRTAELKLLKSENLAFDHALILAYAMLKLQEWEACKEKK